MNYYLRLIIGVGTFDDPWGDIKLDLSHFYHRVKTNANIYADAQKLPFKDMSFEETKAWNILEHLPQWRTAVQDWCRVTKKRIQIEVPIDPGFMKEELITGILSANYPFLRDLPSRRREHLWKFNPQAIIHELRKNSFSAVFSFEFAPFVFRDNNRLANNKIAQLIRSKEMKIKFGYLIDGYRINP